MPQRSSLFRTSKSGEGGPRGDRQPPAGLKIPFLSEVPSSSWPSPSLAFFRNGWRERFETFGAILFGESDLDLNSSRPFTDSLIISSCAQLLPILVSSAILIQLPGASQSLLNKWRALQLYDSQEVNEEEKEKAIEALPKHSISKKVGMSLFSILVVLVPELFLFGTADMKLCPTLTLLRENVAQYYLCLIGLLLVSCEEITSDLVDSIHACTATQSRWLSWLPFTLCFHRSSALFQSQIKTSSLVVQIQRPILSSSPKVPNLQVRRSLLQVLPGRLSSSSLHLPSLLSTNR